MKAVVFEEHGGPDVLQYIEIPERSMTPSQPDRRTSARRSNSV